jgi:tetratricopeptide (TPR) repeat protein
MSESKSFFHFLPKSPFNVLIGLAAIAGIVVAVYTIWWIYADKVPEQQLHELREISKKLDNLPKRDTEEMTAKIKALEEEIGAANAEKAGVLVAAGNKSLELGMKHMEDKEFKKAEREFRDALKFLPASSEAAGYVHISIASACAYQYKWEDALEAYRQVEEMSKRPNKYVLMGLAYSGTGTIYHSISKNDKALVYYEKALEIFKEVGDMKSEGGILFNIATIYEKQGMTQEAVDNLEDVVRIDEAIKNPDMAQHMAYLKRLKRTLKKHNSQ